MESRKLAPLVLAWCMYALAALAMSLALSSKDEPAQVLVAPHLVAATLAAFLTHKHAPKGPTWRDVAPWSIVTVVIFFVVPLAAPAGMFSDEPTAATALTSMLIAGTVLPLLVRVMQLLEVLAVRILRRLG